MSLSRFGVAVASLALLALATCAPQQAAAQTCINEHGKAVDWFIALKMPKHRQSDYPGIAAGLAYLYGDSLSWAGGSSEFFSASPNQMGDATGAIARTLQQIYDQASSPSTGYVMYNDEQPNNGPVSESYGHTKGQLMWSATTGQGFWLIHSVPKMAPSPAQGETAFEYPKSGVDYGQSMLCISMDIANMDQALLQLQFTNPQVYGSQWATALTSQMPNGDAFVNQGTVTLAAASNIANVTSLGGVIFTHFAKTVKWDQSIMGSLIGPYYGQDLVAETWMRPYEGPDSPPDTTRSVYSVRTLAHPAWGHEQWKESEDHSKYGIAADRSFPLTCIGDINHQISQWKRSGGFACLVDATVNGAFAALIQTTDESSSDEQIAQQVAQEATTAFRKKLQRIALE